MTSFKNKKLNPNDIADIYIDTLDSIKYYKDELLFSREKLKIIQREIESIKNSIYYYKRKAKYIEENYSKELIANKL